MEGKNYLKLDDLRSYKLSFHLSNYVWDAIIKWDYFERDTVGKQFVRSIDSISANIAEGFGRYGKNDKIKFYFYSLGSLNESLDRNEKCKIRGLLSKDDYDHIFSKLKTLPGEINALIKFTRDKLTI